MVALWGVDGWEVEVLGVAQDAGIPHLGCESGVCGEIRAGRDHGERVSCIGLRHKGTGASYIFDATPDLRAQLHDLSGGKKPDGVFLTHGHMGHTTGLLYFGRESVDWKGVRVYGTARMGTYLSSNDPWKFLFQRNLDFRTVTPGVAVALDGGAKVTPLLVPHRDEFTDTVGYIVAGGSKKLLFVPDIDKWEKWETDLRSLAKEMDYLLLDGTFSSPGEVGGRDISEIPHPMMSETRALLDGAFRGKGIGDKGPELWFIHVNHTNAELRTAGDVVKQGQRFQL